jgi:hypothetical protein
VELASAFCKGFSGIVNRKNRTKDMFVELFGTVMQLRRKNLGDEELQTRCLQFMHRMVELLQHEFLQVLLDFLKFDEIFVLLIDFSPTAFGSYCTDVVSGRWCGGCARLFETDGTVD